MVEYVGQPQPKICDQGKTGLSHPNIDEGNLLLWSVFTASCMMPALFPVPEGIQMYSYFLSNKPHEEKYGCLHAPSPKSSTILY